ncbi:MAG: tRNA 4-thiouridine(8) synthase ThiI [Patescibacteria group bacterium]|nr:tRNA 4-thiouridine(8) synthase ThiI [Patescibacteria group bacterium]MDD5121410.1 tRNA 4-thiouridine(8) synthase ThiI [Patescibacteria group bacterium]MDD5221864.1 tRNA 4-thiouridine(8) synthase ThiI [Patescibacteria group bacterium]MDD5395671.1 tRNA 4-thiouridine(8) synthase ThiI [Patescibacteria group bacterium]
MAKALCLFSGGLDSILAVKLLQEQAIKVTGLTFVSCFFNATIPEKMAAKISLPLRVVDISSEHLTIVKDPRYGYGKNMNPCLDCHLMMLKKAGEMMRREGFDFVATGEVLGERPFSQNESALKLLEKKSSLEGYLLRPLSAKLLASTIAENRSIVGRDKLMDISGRSRQKQMALAQQYNLEDYPTPAGGCLLTDPAFGQRLKEMFNKWPQADIEDMELLKVGRNFWHEDVLCVVGRNHKENQQLKKISRTKDILVEPDNVAGPTVLIRFKKTLDRAVKNELIKLAEGLIKKYMNQKYQDKNIEFLVEFF